MLVSLVGGRGLSEGGSAAGHAHFGQDVADGSKHSAHLVFAQPSDAADAEAVGHGQLARVDDVALAREPRSEEHTSELQSHHDLVCRLLLEKKKKKKQIELKLNNKKNKKI